MFFSLLLITFGVYLGQEYNLPVVKNVVSNMVTYFQDLNQHKSSVSNKSSVFNVFNNVFSVFTSLSNKTGSLLSYFSNKNTSTSVSDLQLQSLSNSVNQKNDMSEYELDHDKKEY